MQFNLNLDLTEPRQLAALAALVDSLMGRSTAAIPSADSPRACGHDHTPNAETIAALQEAETLGCERTITTPATDPAEALLQAAAANKSDVPTHDSEGVPWDARIHSNPPSFVKGDIWRKKRGVDETLYTTVTAELKAAMAAPAAPAPVEAPSAPAAPAADPAQAFAPPPPAAAAAPPPPVEQAAPAAPAATPAPAAPAPDASYTADMAGFAKLMSRITTLEAGGMVPTRKNEVAVQLGLSAARDLVHRQDLIPAFGAMIDQG